MRFRSVSACTAVVAPPTPWRGGGVGGFSVAVARSTGRKKAPIWDLEGRMALTKKRAAKLSASGGLDRHTGSWAPQIHCSAAAESIFTLDIATTTARFARAPTELFPILTMTYVMVAFCRLLGPVDGPDPWWTSCDHVTMHWPGLEYQGEDEPFATEIMKHWDLGLDVIGIHTCIPGRQVLLPCDMLSTLEPECRVKSSTPK
jgi:hypothetical protein